MEFITNLNKKISSHILLIILVIITVLITYFKIRIQISIGPIWDTFDFLANALEFAGKGIGYADLDRPPFLSFLTSLFFRLGFVSEIAIFIVDGLIFIFGVIGLYLLLNLRFNKLQSFIGSIIFISFPVVLLWAGAGYTDIASTSFSIWAIYLTVLSIRKNPNFFYLAFPFATLAFLTRFPAALIILPMLFYILINRGKVKNFRHIVIGLSLSLLIMVPVFIFFYKTFGNPLQPFLQIFSVTVSNNVGKFGYNPDPFFYITNAWYGLINLDLLNKSSLVAVIFLIFEIMILCSFLMGIVIYTKKILKSRDIGLMRPINSLKLKKTKLIKISATIILFLIFLGTLGKINFLFSDIIFLILSFMLYQFLKHEKLQNLDIDFLFLTWLISYLIFSSFFEIKVYRYFIPMTPALVYFIILGLSQFSAKIKFNIKKIPINSILSFLLILTLLFSTVSYLFQLENDPLAHGLNVKIHPTEEWFDLKIKSEPLYFENYNTKGLKNVAEWLKVHDPDYKENIIYSDGFGPHLSWYLKTNVKTFPNENKKYIYAQLKEQNVDYYISMVPDINLKNYNKVSEFKTSFGNVIIYEKQK